MKSGFVDVNGVSVFYEVRGSGPAMVMIHGNGEDHTIFDKAASALEDRFTIYLPDSRGHGRSSPVDEYHYQDMADDLDAFVRVLGLERPIVVGFSDGGIIGLKYASQHPDGLSRLFACGANSNPDALKGMWAWMLRHRRDVDPKERMMLTEPHITAEDLSEISVPVSVVVGSRDCIRRSDTEFISSSIRDSETIVVPGSDHCRYIYDGTIAGIVIDVMSR